jgi:muconolactone delta-isomerase
MKIHRRRVATALLLATVALNLSFTAFAQNQNFSWTVTGTGTETWYGQNVTYASKTASVSAWAFNPSDTEYLTAGAGGQGTYSVNLNAGPGTGNCSATVSYGTTIIFQDAVGNGNNPPSKSDSGTFQAVAGQTYTLNASIFADASSSIEVTVPQSVQTITNTATRTATMNGNGVVNPSDGQKSVSGFYAPPQPQNGGAISGVSYSLTWNNPNVVMFFSDTLTTNTTNPNAFVIAATSGPYGGIAQPIPGHICIERFDTGGEGIAYHSPDGTNHGDFRLSDNVSVTDQEVADTGYYKVFWTAPGEWVKYSISVAQSGYYSIIVWAGKIDGASTNHVEIDGVNVTGQLTIQNTGSWNYQPLRKDGVYLTSGYHVLKLVMDGCGPDWGNGNFNGIDVAMIPQITQQPVPQIARLNSNVTFSVGTSPATLAYQWFFNSNQIAGATNSVLTFSSIQYSNSGFYMVACTNLAGAVVSTNAQLIVTGPYLGIPQTVPGHIRVERFDVGGEGISYRSPDGTNHGDFRPSDNVSVTDQELANTGFYKIFWTAPGEWIDYTINATHSGYYSIILSAGKIDGASTNHISIDGTNVTGQLTIANTGSWAYQLLRKDGVYISRGSHVLTLAMDGCGPDWGNGNFDDINVVDYGDPQIQTNNASFGLRANRFGFTVAGMSNQVVVIEACTNLSNGPWLPLQTNTLQTNSFDFYDASWTNYSRRFYRTHLP